MQIPKLVFYIFEIFIFPTVSGHTRGSYIYHILHRSLWYRHQLQRHSQCAKPFAKPLESHSQSHSLYHSQRHARCCRAIHKAILVVNFLKQFSKGQETTFWNIANILHSVFVIHFWKIAKLDLCHVSSFQIFHSLGSHAGVISLLYITQFSLALPPVATPFAMRKTIRKDTRKPFARQFALPFV